MILLLRLSLILFSLSPLSAALHSVPGKVVICGVCRNTERSVENTIAHIEKLGKCFADYGVIIYENNSQDRTAELYGAWAKSNPHVLFCSEKLTSQELPFSRTEKIACARNKVLSILRNSCYSDFDYFIMVDLDFVTPWPLEEILKSIESPIEWDCISANGMLSGTNYHDRYALRCLRFPLGPELIRKGWWREVTRNPIDLTKNLDEWFPVYSAFGGLAIYKMKAALSAEYSGIVTEDLEAFYKGIIASLPCAHPHVTSYCSQHKKNFLHLIGFVHAPSYSLNDFPLAWTRNSFSEHSKEYKPVTCCEHVPFHASMTLKGYNKLYVNPRLMMLYEYD